MSVLLNFRLELGLLLNKVLHVDFVWIVIVFNQGILYRLAKPFLVKRQFPLSLVSWVGLRAVSLVSPLA